VPLAIRGFGHIKEANLEKAKAREAQLLADFRHGEAPILQAAE
jgi:indolepyruvate ferredoxin oxidoreductase